MHRTAAVALLTLLAATGCDEGAPDATDERLAERHSIRRTIPTSDDPDGDVVVTLFYDAGEISIDEAEAILGNVVLNIEEADQVVLDIGPEVLHWADPAEHPFHLDIAYEELYWAERAEQIASWAWDSMVMMEDFCPGH